jgi:hypothetical protein
MAVLQASVTSGSFDAHSISDKVFGLSYSLQMSFNSGVVIQ